MTDLTRYAIELARAAVVLDTQKRYEDARPAYEVAIKHLLVAIKHEKVTATRVMLQKKTAEYLTRAELLKKSLTEPVATATEIDTVRLESSIVLVETPDVAWSEIVGLERAKQALKEAAILPIRFPELFTGPREPWRGILLYGAPGTGKTLLVKALATDSKSTFLTVKASDLLSKWQGVSEQLVRGVFELARTKKPSIIFVDEVEALLSARSDNDTESSRRIKSEFLVQLQGIGNANQSGILFVGATNLPWSLDPAILRRFDKKVYIDLPTLEARIAFLNAKLSQFTSLDVPEDFVGALAVRTDGYSCSDLTVLLREAIMAPIRTLQAATHFRPVDERWTPCDPTDERATAITWDRIAARCLVEPPVTMEDFEEALTAIKATVSESDLARFEQWTADFGQKA